jgi:hypothetical protein
MDDHVQVEQVLRKEGGQVALFGLVPDMFYPIEIRAYAGSQLNSN